MPRGNRHHLPGYVWHITSRCHRSQFLLKFAGDRDAWTYWLFEARKQFRLRVLDYNVTSNHIHLVVMDRGEKEVGRGVQLVEGCPVLRECAEAYKCVSSGEMTRICSI